MKNAIIAVFVVLSIAVGYACIVKFALTSLDTAASALTVRR